MWEMALPDINVKSTVNLKNVHASFICSWSSYCENKTDPICYLCCTNLLDEAQNCEWKTSKLFQICQAGKLTYTKIRLLQYLSFAIKCTYRINVLCHSQNRYICHQTNNNCNLKKHCTNTLCGNWNKNIILKNSVFSFVLFVCFICLFGFFFLKMEYIYIYIVCSQHSLLTDKCLPWM